MSTHVETAAPAMLRNASRALAQHALGRHAELDPDVFQRYGPGGREAWRRDAQARLANLAAALEVGRPELFTDFVRWQGEGYRARGADLGDLRRHLECLGQVLRTELPAPASAACASAVEAAVAALDAPPQRPAPTLADDAPHRDLARRVLVHLLEWDGEEAERLVRDAVAAGLALEDLYSHVFVPIEVEVGRLWHAGELSIAEEHFVTGSIQSLMARTSAERARPTGAAQAILITAVGGDAHDMAVRMLCDHFAWAGWRVVSLGAGTPAEDTVEALAHSGARLLALSATLVSHVAAARETIRAVRADPRTSAVRVLVGGHPFNVAEGLWQEIGADGYAADASGAVRRAEQLAGA